MKHFVFLNGPPKCGKDTVASNLVPYVQFRHMKMASPIKRAVAALLDIDQRTLEATKDEQHNTLWHPGRVHTEGKQTIRSLLIGLSEEFIKPRYGSDWFGRAALHECNLSPDNLFIFSDAGFVEEVQRVVAGASRDRCLLIRIHREGCNFSGDSRSYLPDGLCRTLDLHNNESIHNLTMRVLRAIIRPWKLPLLRDPVWIKD